MTISADEARELLDYNPETGNFTWKRRDCKWFSLNRFCKTWNKNFAGKTAGGINSVGYHVIAVLNKQILSHRLAWLYVYGEWPKGQIDHINGNRSDNRIVNLRDVTANMNQQNLKRGQRNNTYCNYLGVSLLKRTGRYYAQIMYDGKRLFLGYFDTPEEAQFVYMKAKARYHRGYVAD